MHFRRWFPWGRFAFASLTLACIPGLSVAQQGPPAAPPAGVGARAPEELLVDGTADCLAGVIVGVVVDNGIVQLGVNGSSSLLILEDLAKDPSFKGSALLEINPIYFFFVDQEPGRLNRAEEKLVAHQNTSFWNPWEQRLLMGVQSRFVFGLPQLSPQEMETLTWLLSETFHPEGFAQFRDDKVNLKAIDLPAKGVTPSGNIH